MNGEANNAAPQEGRGTVPDPGHPRILLYPAHDAASDNDFSDDEVEELNKNDDQGPSGVKRDFAVSSSKDATADQHNGGLRKSARRRVKSIGHGAKQKSKHLIAAARSRVGIAEPTPDDSPYAELDNNPAFDPNHLIGDKRVTVGGTADKIMGAVYAAGKAVAHPGTAAKKKAAGKVAIQDRPYLSQQADLDYLDAHANLSRAESSRSRTSDDEDENFPGLEESQARVAHLDDVRDGRKVAWLTSKHMHRVVVTPKREPIPPNKDEFYVLDPETGQQKFDRQGFFFEHVRYQLKAFALNRMGDVDPAGQEPFSKEVMLRYAERILIATSPWQSWFLNLRSLYRWDKPARTAKYAAIWFLIWWSDYMMTAVFIYVVYIVLQNKYSKKNVDVLRASHDRARSDNETAFRFNELINRHGSQDWVDPLIDEVGPLLQMQTSDLADFLEILSNFYDWRYPYQTWATLFWFAVAIVIGVLTDTGYSVKIVWMFCLLSFFLGRPVASKHPQYRHTVNALKWIFWDIPTDTQWAMMYLRNKAQETRARLIGDEIEKRHNEETRNLAAVPELTALLDVSGPKSTHPPNVSDSEDSDVSDAESYATADSSTSILGSHLDLVSFKCRHKGHPGRLIIYSDGLRFVRTSSFSKRQHQTWRHPWFELIEMRKVNSSTVAKLVNMEGLELVFREYEPSANDKSDDHHHSILHHHRNDDSEDAKDRDTTIADQAPTVATGQIATATSTIKLEGVVGRDRAFNCILGFSGLRFSVLQPLAEAKKGRGKEKARMAKGKDKKNEDVEKGERANGDVSVVEGPGMGLGKEEWHYGDDLEKMEGSVDLKGHGGRSKGFFD